MRVTDDDVSTVRVSPAVLRVGEGATATYAVRLNARPAGNVVLDVASDNADVTVDTERLTFTTNNWQTPQTVTVTAAHDADLFNDQASITHTIDMAATLDTAYDAATVTSVAVTVLDDDAEIGHVINAQGTEDSSYLRASSSAPPRWTSWSGAAPPTRSCSRPGRRPACP